MLTKMRPCCARLQSKVTMAETDLRRLALRAQRREEQLPRFLPKIAEAKAVIADYKAAVEDHEAEHAGEA